jgi:glycosyltransferase involved in cell wall biosynthesis
MPYIVLEAMASGVPVVATPVDGARDLLVHGESGFVAEAITAEALHAEVLRILALAPDARAALGSRGRERLAEGYSIDRMVSGLLDVYAELA